MSYILDALKKSEKERSLGNVPTLGTTTQQEERRVPLRWFVITVAVLGLAIALGGGWVLWSARTSQAPAADVTAAPGAKSPAASAAEAAGAAPVARMQAAPAAGPVHFSDLDDSARSRIPEIRINVLSYAESSARRFVMIGQDIFKEGEEVRPGVYIDEIRNADVVFRFEGVRFLLEP